MCVCVCVCVCMCVCVVRWEDGKEDATVSETVFMIWWENKEGQKQLLREKQRLEREKTRKGMIRRSM